jgi:hypothetical protein
LGEKLTKWPDKIPEVGDVVQVQVDELIFESRVLSRSTQKDQRTFIIRIESPHGQSILLDITPDATAHGMVDRFNDEKPYWRTVPSGIDGIRKNAVVYNLG